MLVAVFWLRGAFLHDAGTLPLPGLLTAEIAERLETARVQFSKLATSLHVEALEDGQIP